MAVKEDCHGYPGAGYLGEDVENRLKSAICQICIFENGGSGTGIFVIWDHKKCILTNNHVLKKREKIDEDYADLWFNFIGWEKGSEKTDTWTCSECNLCYGLRKTHCRRCHTQRPRNIDTRTGQPKLGECTRLLLSPDDEQNFFTNKLLDFSLCVLAPEAYKKIESWGIESLPLEKPSPDCVPAEQCILNVWGYPEGRIRSRSSGAIKSIDGFLVGYQNATKSGSSGSGCFVNDELVALHHQSDPQRKENQGTLVTSILKNLAEQAGPDPHESLSKIKDMFMQSKNYEGLLLVQEMVDRMKKPNDDDDGKHKFIDPEPTNAGRPKSKTELLQKYSDEFDAVDKNLLTQLISEELIDLKDWPKSQSSEARIELSTHKQTLSKLQDEVKHLDEDLQDAERGQRWADCDKIVKDKKAKLAEMEEVEQKIEILEQQTKEIMTSGIETKESMQTKLSDLDEQIKEYVSHMDFLSAHKLQQQVLDLENQLKSIEKEIEQDYSNQIVDVEEKINSTRTKLHVAVNSSDFLTAHNLQKELDVLTDNKKKLEEKQGSSDHSVAQSRKKLLAKLPALESTITNFDKEIAQCVNEKRYKEAHDLRLEKNKTMKEIYEIKGALLFDELDDNGEGRLQWVAFFKKLYKMNIELVE